MRPTLGHVIPHRRTRHVSSLLSAMPRKAGPGPPGRRAADSLVTARSTGVLCRTLASGARAAVARAPAPRPSSAEELSPQLPPRAGRGVAPRGQARVGPGHRARRPSAGCLLPAAWRGCLPVNLSCNCPVVTARLRSQPRSCGNTAQRGEVTLSGSLSQGENMCPSPAEGQDVSRRGGCTLPARPSPTPAGGPSPAPTQVPPAVASAPVGAGRGPRGWLLPRVASGTRT